MPKFLSNVDLTGNQLLNALVQNLATEPTPTLGRLFYNTGTNKLGIGNGTSFDYVGDLTALNLDDVPDSATRLAFLPAERTKLTGIATGATANAADATLLARANHTGTQVAATISDFATASDLRVVAGITGKANIASPTFTGTVGGITKAMVGLTNVDDTSDADKPVSTAQAAANTADKARANHTGTQLASTISDFSAAADVRIQLIVDAAPATLDTLNELAAALGDDPNFAATISADLAAKQTAINLRALDSAVPHKHNALIGNGALTSIVVTHNLNTLYTTQSVCQVADNVFVECDIVATTANTTTFSFTTAPALNALRVTILG